MRALERERERKRDEKENTSATICANVAQSALFYSTWEGYASLSPSHMAFPERAYGFHIQWRRCSSLISAAPLLVWSGAAEVMR